MGYRIIERSRHDYTCVALQDVRDQLGTIHVEESCNQGDSVGIENGWADLIAKDVGALLSMRLVLVANFLQHFSGLSFGFSHSVGLEGRKVSLAVTRSKE